MTKLINFADLKSSKGIAYSRDHLRRMVKEGRFPAPVPLSEARIAWRESDIDDWVERRFQAGIENGTP